MGNCKPYRIDLTGRIFGQMRVLGYSHKHGAYSCWLCECSCGTQKAVLSTALTQGYTKSCGCSKAVFLKSLAKHGQCGTPMYRAWAQMIQRCTNPDNRHFHNYGGRGITVCDEWKSFDRFKADMGERPPGLSLDRIDNNRGYSKENCRWATHSQQMRNRRPRNEWSGGRQA